MQNTFGGPSKIIMLKISSGPQVCGISTLTRVGRRTDDGLRANNRVMLMSDDVSSPTSKAEALPGVALTGEIADHPGLRPFETPSGQQASDTRADAGSALQGFCFSARLVS